MAVIYLDVYNCMQLILRNVKLLNIC